jgi:hypothetical protein
VVTELSNFEDGGFVGASVGMNVRVVDRRRQLGVLICGSKCSAKIFKDLAFGRYPARDDRRLGAGATNFTGRGNWMGEEAQGGEPAG